MALCHDIAPDKRSAFANRLKHLQKLGFLPDIRTGRGKAADYKGHHVFLLGLALQFIELGLTPERTIFVIRENLNFVLIPTRFAMRSLTTETKPLPYFVRFDPSILDSLRYDNPLHDDASETTFYGGIGTIADTIEDMGTQWPRLSLINMTSLVSQTFSSFHEVDPTLADTFEAELTAWLDTYPDHPKETEFDR